MATDKRPPSDTPGARRRRPASTIELKATEIASDPVAPEPHAASAASQPASPQPPRHEPFYAQHDPFPQPPRDPPPRQPKAGAWPTWTQLSWLPADIPWPMVGAGAAGAVIVLLPLLLVFWLAGALSSPPDTAAALQPKLAAIETRLRDLAARPSPPSVDPRAIDALAARLGKLETAVAAPRSPQTDPALLNRLAANDGALKSLSDQIGSRLGASESAVKSLTGQVAALTQRIDAAAAVARDAQGRADAAAVAARDANSRAAGAATAAAAVQTNTRAATAGSDRAVRLALVASSLRAAVERGDPFAGELAAVKAVGDGASALAPLEPFAATGIPSNDVLGHQLSALIPAMLRAAQPSRRDGGFLDRLQANAERLVRVRPIDAKPGDDPTAVLSRIESKAVNADVTGALADLAKLPPAVRAPAQDWIARAEQRTKAIEAGRRFAADAIAGLKATQ